MENINVLIVDDHYLMVEAYKSLLLNAKNFKSNIITAHNCFECFKIIDNQAFNNYFNLVLLDVNLPPYLDFNIHSGTDLALLIRKNSPQTRIVILTSHSESILLYNIINKVKPQGLLIKSEFSTDDFLKAVNIIISGEQYFSPGIKENLDQIISHSFYLDSYHRQIISLLSKGIRSKNLPNYLPLSMSAIDKRKAQIKIYFGVDYGTDEDIIFAARKAKLI